MGFLGLRELSGSAMMTTTKATRQRMRTTRTTRTTMRKQMGRDRLCPSSVQVPAGDTSNTPFLLPVLMLIEAADEAPHSTEEVKPALLWVNQCLWCVFAAGVCNKLKWLFAWPLCLLLYFTIPNCSKPRWDNWFMLSFVASTLWIAGFSYIMVWMVSHFPSTHINFSFPFGELLINNYFIINCSTENWQICMNIWPPDRNMLNAC